MKLLDYLLNYMLFKIFFYLVKYFIILQTFYSNLKSEYKKLSNLLWLYHGKIG